MPIQLDLLEERIIERRGIFQIPNSWNRYNPLVLRADLVVLPRTYYSNFTYQPSKGKWSNINFMHGSRVTRSFVQEYAYQEFNVFEYGFTQIAELFNCAEQNIVSGQSLIGTGIQRPVIIVPGSSTASGLENYPLYPDDSILIHTYNDARIRYRLYQLPAFECRDNPLSKDVIEGEQIPQPVAQDNVDKDTTYPISQPYIPPDDNGFTYIPPDPVPANWEVKVFFDAIAVPGTPSAGNPLPGRAKTISVPDSNWIGRWQRVSRTFSTCPSVQQWETWAENTIDQSILGLQFSSTCHDWQNFSTATINNV